MLTLVLCCELDYRHSSEFPCFSAKVRFFVPGYKLLLKSSYFGQKKSQRTKTISPELFLIQFEYFKIFWVMVIGDLCLNRYPSRVCYV